MHNIHIPCGINKICRGLLVAEDKKVKQGHCPYFNLIYFSTGSESARKIMAEIMTLLKPINASALDSGGGGTDIGPWMEAGAPGASLKNDNDRYFYFHHSNGK